MRDLPSSLKMKNPYGVVWQTLILDPSMRQSWSTQKSLLSQNEFAGKIATIASTTDRIAPTTLFAFMV
jgi:hypothetical protein